MEDGAASEENAENIAKDDVDYVFGYGSIINSISRGSTLQCLSATTDEVIVDHAVFATVSSSFGYRRCWCYRSSTGFTALGLKYCGDNGSEGVDNALDLKGIGGVLFPIPNAAALAAFDLRETGYTRVQIPLEYVTVTATANANAASPPTSSSTFISSSLATSESANDCSLKPAIANGKIWIYIPDTSRIADPDENFPLLQTYIDTCVRGCLEWGGTSFVSDFLLTTSGWNEFYLNDAPMSRRPWLHRPEYSIIDKCLEKLDSHVKFSERKHPEEFSTQHLTTLRGENNDFHIISLYDNFVKDN